MNVVLVEPQIPQNTGNIARTCAATGSALHLCGPLGFSIDEAAVKRAGLDYWPLLTLHRHDSIEALMDKHPADAFFFFSTHAPRSYHEVSYPPDAFLVFGKETAGLPRELVERYAQQAVRIPMRSDARSLNLSNSVALALYEALRQNDFPGLTLEGGYELV